MHEVWTPYAQNASCTYMHEVWIMNFSSIYRVNSRTKHHSFHCSSCFAPRSGELTEKHQRSVQHTCQYDASQVSYSTRTASNTCGPSTRTCTVGQRRLLVQIWSVRQLPTHSYMCSQVIFCTLCCCIPCKPIMQLLTLSVSLPELSREKVVWPYISYTPYGNQLKGAETMY